MNQSLHFYLNALVGHAKQLVITADNPKIPFDLRTDQNHGEDGSTYSGHSSYSGYASYCHLLDLSAGSHSSVGSSSRWDSEGNKMNFSKEHKPKQPLRRQNDCSPPASPTIDHQRRRRSLSEGSVEDNYCESSAPQKLSLKGALRMPVRQDSGDCNGNELRRRDPTKSKRVRNKSKSSSSSSTRKKVDEILNQAMHDLAMDEETPARLGGDLALSSKASHAA